MILCSPTLMICKYSLCSFPSKYCFVPGAGLSNSFCSALEILIPTNNRLPKSFIVVLESDNLNAISRNGDPDYQIKIGPLYTFPFLPAKQPFAAPRFDSKDAGLQIACGRRKRIGMQNREAFDVFYTPQFMPVRSLRPGLRPLARL